MAFLPPLDEADRRILNALQRSNRHSLHELAEIVGMSPQTCHRRLQRLRNSNIIEREAVLIDPRRSPKPFTVFVKVKLEPMNEESKRKFEARIAQFPEIMQVYIISGPFDYLLVVNLADIAEFDRFADDFLVESEQVHHFESTMVLRRVKFETAIDF